MEDVTFTYFRPNLDLEHDNSYSLMNMLVWNVTVKHIGWFHIMKYWEDTGSFELEPNDMLYVLSQLSHPA